MVKNGIILVNRTEKASVLEIYYLNTIHYKDS
jgi:hypothetical protein